MQTFLPYADFKETAKVLDRQRLGKQRVETLQIMKSLCDPEYGWKNHPVVKMWRGHEGVLYEYQQAICNEWTSRGYKDTCLEKTTDIMSGKALIFTKPAWLGDEELHLSHRSNLVRKLPEVYGILWDVEDNLPYIWPVN